MTTPRSNGTSTKKPENESDEIKASWRDGSSARVLVANLQCCDCLKSFPVYSTRSLKFERCAHCAASLCVRKFGTRVVK